MNEKLEKLLLDQLFLEEQIQIEANHVLERVSENQKELLLQIIELHLQMENRIRYELSRLQELDSFESLY